MRRYCPSADGPTFIPNTVIMQKFLEKNTKTSKLTKVDVELMTHIHFMDEQISGLNTVNLLSGYLMIMQKLKPRWIDFEFESMYVVVK